MIFHEAMFSREVVLLAAVLIEVRSEIFSIDPKHFEGNPACVELNRTFYSYIEKIVKDLNREYKTTVKIERLTNVLPPRNAEIQSSRTA